MDLSKVKVGIVLVNGDEYSTDYDKCYSCQTQSLCKMYDRINSFCDAIASLDQNYIPCVTNCEWFIQQGEDNG